MPIYELAAQVDARGESGRTPIDHTARVLRALGRGAVVEVLTTDPAVMAGLRTWTRANGHDVISSTSDGRTYCVVIRHH